MKLLINFKMETICVEIFNLYTQYLALDFEITGSEATRKIFLRNSPSANKNISINFFERKRATYGVEIKITF